MFFLIFFFFFFFNATATTEIYTLSLHDALPIREPPGGGDRDPVRGAGPRAPRPARLGPAPGSEDLLTDPGSAHRDRRGPAPPGGRGPGRRRHLLVPGRSPHDSGHSRGASVLRGPRSGPGSPEPGGGDPVGRGDRGPRAHRAEAPRGRAHRGRGQVGHGSRRPGARHAGDESGASAGRTEEKRGVDRRSGTRRWHAALGDGPDRAPLPRARGGGGGVETAGGPHL